MRTLKAVLALAVLLAVAACGDRHDIAEGKRSYQGKPDSRPWDNEPLADASAKWSKGDRASWEAGIKARQLTQHEYRRIEQ
jgi:hypothetical protein